MPPANQISTLQVSFRKQLVLQPLAVKVQSTSPGRSVRQCAGAEAFCVTTRIEAMTTEDKQYARCLQSEITVSVSGVTSSASVCTKTVHVPHDTARKVLCTLPAMLHVYSDSKDTLVCI